MTWWCQTQYAVPCNVRSQTWMIRITGGMSLKCTCLVHPQESEVGPEHLNSQQIPHAPMESENHSSRAPLAWTTWEVFSLRDLAKSDSPLSGEAGLPVTASWVWATCSSLIRLTSSVLSLSNKSDVLDRGQEPLKKKFLSPILLPHCSCACVLSHFSCVWLFATPWTVAHQAPLSMGFSRQEYWSGLPCSPPGDHPNPGMESKSHYATCVGRRVLYHLGSHCSYRCCQMGSHIRFSWAGGRKGHPGEGTAPWPAHTCDWTLPWLCCSQAPAPVPWPTSETLSLGCCF